MVTCCLVAVLQLVDLVLGGVTCTRINVQAIIHYRTAKLSGYHGSHNVGPA